MYGRVPSNNTEYICEGILFSKMVLELGDMCVVKNEKHRLFCDLEFKTKVTAQLLG